MVVSAEDAEQCRQRQGDDEHGDVEDELVGRAEQVDHELLRARRLQVDDERADRGHERRRARDRACQELAQGEANPTGDEPGDGRPKALLHARSEAHRRDGRVTRA